MVSNLSRNNLLGIASLCLGALVFSLQDSAIKSISGSEAVTLAIVFRACISMPILLVMVAFRGGLGQLRDKQWRLLLLRGAVLLVSYTSYFMAFPALPLAEAIALYFMVPLIVTLLAGPMLGEHVSWKSWTAIAIGLVGVFVILQPGTALFSPAALLSLISAAAYATAQLLARKYGSGSQATVMAFYQNAVYLVGAAAIAALVAALGLKPPGHPSLDFLFRAWAIPSLHDAVLMGVCGVIAAFGSTLLANAYRVGVASVVTPFEYTGMIWAGTFGFLFFGEIPRATTITGMALIAMAGILALRAATTSHAPEILSEA
jgi:drug/metabolite transporter (DMT)-like permease